MILTDWQTDESVGRGPYAAPLFVARRQMGDTIAWADENVAMRPKLYLFPDDTRPFVAIFE